MNGQQDIADSPTPEEIRQARLKIQAGWSETQERNRRGIRGIRGIRETYQFPMVDEAWFSEWRLDHG